MNSVQQQKTTEALAAKPHLRSLYERLLSMGGDFATIWNEGLHTDDGFVALLLSAGRISSGRNARLREGQACHCHSNSEALAIKYPHRYQRETGWALSEDGWRSHSWVWDVKETRIVETTGVRKLYFGITLRISDKERAELLKSKRKAGNCGLKI